MSEFVFYKENGKITNPMVVKKAFDQLADGAYVCRFHTRKQRSLPQDKYYWSICLDMVLEALNDAGYDEVKTKDDAHVVVKSLFLKRNVVNHSTGQVIEIIGSTKDLTTVQFNDFIEKIAKWLAEFFGVTLPLPNQQAKIWNPDISSSAGR